MCLQRRLWVALPDSLLVDEPTLREKTEKVGWVGRCLAIFGVQKLFIYHDADGTREDAELMKLLLEYMETPPYLRKLLFPLRGELRYAGLLPPLKMPHHVEEVDWGRVSAGMVREGVVVRDRDGCLVEVGLSRPVELDGPGRVGERVTVVFTQGAPNPRCRRARAGEAPPSPAYTVLLAEGLARLIRSANPDLCIATSRLGRPVHEVWGALLDRLASAASILLLFGSPRRGLYEIARGEGWRLEELTDFIVNLFPDQRVATVRTEEALMGGLSIINLGLHSLPAG
jgi:predicted SPOUT superfamily RNA methylase MTH1